MSEVRKLALRLSRMGSIAGLFALSLAAVAQTYRPPHSETNHTREARIARTVEETYSHRWEIFGGGGYLRWKSGDATQKNNEISWATSANYYLNPKLAIVGDARGYFGNARALRSIGFEQITRPQINEYNFMGGASYRFYAKERLALSGQALGGAVWGIFSGGSKGIPATTLGLWPSGFRPGFSLGLSGDYNFYPELAFRVTPTYVGTTFGGEVQNNFGFNAGILYRFGHR